MKKAAIIGGGAAGLCCACELLSLAGGRVAVTLFEQKDRWDAAPKNWNSYSF